MIQSKNPLEMFKLAVDIFKKYYKEITVFVLITTTPVFVLSNIMPNIKDAIEIFNQNPYETELILSYFLTYVMIHGAFNTILIAALTLLTSFALFETDPSNKDLLYNNSIAKSPKYIITYFLYVVFIYCGFGLVSVHPLLAVPAVIYFAVNYYYAVSYATVSKSWGLHALMGSKVIVQGNFFRTFSIIVFAHLCQFIVTMLRYYLFFYLPDNIVILYILIFIENYINVIFKIICIIWFFHMHYEKITNSILKLMDENKNKDS